MTSAPFRPPPSPPIPRQWFTAEPRAPETHLRVPSLRYSPLMDGLWHEDEATSTRCIYGGILQAEDE